MAAARDAVAGKTPEGRIAVVAAGFADVVSVASAITAVTGVHVIACVSCVHVRNVYKDTRHTQWLPRLEEQVRAAGQRGETHTHDIISPSALPQFSRGWSTHVALTGCEDATTEEIDFIKVGAACATLSRSAPDTSLVVPHQHVIKLCNPSASLLRLNGGLGRPIATTREVVDDVLTSTGYSLPSAVAHRNVTCPGWHAAHKSAAFRKAARGSVAGEMAAMDAAAAARAQWRACEAQIDGVCPLPDNVCAFRGRMHARVGTHTLTLVPSQLPSWSTCLSCTTSAA